MTIISQDYELINFDKLAKVTMYEGEVDGTTVYAIVGFESASSDDAEISGDSDTVLGIYNNTTECENVLLALAFQGFFIIVALAIFKTLFNNTLKNMMSGQDVVMTMATLLGFVVAFIFTIFRTSSISKSAFAAH